MIVIHYIRSIIAATFALIFFTVFSLIMLPILWLIGKFSLITREKGARFFTRWGLRLVMFTIGTKTVVKGMENIPDEACLFVGNHRSYFDVMTTYPVMKNYRLGFIGKKEFGKLYTFKVWMDYCGCFFLDRSNPRAGMKTINDAAKAIKEGLSVWIYPEGTRNHSAELLEFKEGSFKIAEKARCKIVPVAHVHTDDVFELHMPYAVPTTVTTEFGKPIETEGLDRDGLKAAYEQCKSEIERMYKANY